MCNMFSTFFFDMDGTLFDSMPNHVLAWTDTFARYGIPFTPRDCYLNEGRTSRDVIRLLANRAHVPIADSMLEQIYAEKTAFYRRVGGGKPMRDMDKVLAFLTSYNRQIWVVTGGGQVDLYEQLESFFQGIFRRDRIITAMDVERGKPAPDPYLKAWERCGQPKEQCCVIENAPLGVMSGKAAGLFTIAVNTGALTRQDLLDAGADVVLDDMNALAQWLRQNAVTLPE